MSVSHAKRALRVEAGARRRAAHTTQGETAGATLRDRVLTDIEIAPDAAISGYWPMRDEIDPRPLLHAAHELGFRCLLPVVQRRGAPLRFRVWHPDMTLVAGSYGERIPGPDAAEAEPSVLLVPLLAFDRAGYRLGYGGGYFDRTLAAIRPRPFAIGVGIQAARLKTIFPQPHDIAMDAIVTEDGLQWEAET